MISRPLPLSEEPINSAYCGNPVRLSIDRGAVQIVNIQPHLAALFRHSLVWHTSSTCSVSICFEWPAAARSFPSMGWYPGSSSYNLKIGSCLFPARCWAGPGFCKTTYYLLSYKFSGEVFLEDAMKMYSWAGCYMRTAKWMHYAFTVLNAQLRSDPSLSEGHMIVITPLF